MSKSCIKNIKIGDRIAIDPLYINGANIPLHYKNIKFTIVGKWRNLHLLGINEPGVLPFFRFHYLPETYDLLADKFEYFYLADLYLNNTTIKIYKNV